MAETLSPPVHAFDPAMAPDSEFEPGQLLHLAPGNEGRMLDRRRTPVRVVEIRPATGQWVCEVMAFEDQGAHWTLPLERVGSYQFARGARRAGPSALRQMRLAVRKFDRPDLPLVQRLLSLDIHTYLPDNNLMLVDRSTMAVGLEARVPLLDRQLVEYAFSLPAGRLVRPGATKIAFREAIRPWLPEAILARSKSGFSPPFKRWVGGAGREAAFRALERGDLAADGVLDPRGVRVLVESGTQRRHNKLWLLLNLEAWYRRWIRGREILPASPRQLKRV